MTKHTQPSTWTLERTLLLITSLSLALGVLNALDNPARRGLVIELVEPDEISNAMALNTAVMTGSRIVGPALAAFLRGVVGGGRPVGWLFLLNGLSFAAIVGGDTVGVSKPDPAPIRAMVERAGGGRAIFVGDTINDIAGARNAGIPSIAVSFGFLDGPVENLEADAVIHHFDELVPTLERIG